MREATGERMIPLAIQTNALIEEPLVRVPGGLSANRKLFWKPFGHRPNVLRDPTD
jgi:hypothetical protein